MRTFALAVLTAAALVGFGSAASAEPISPADHVGQWPTEVGATDHVGQWP